MPRLTLLLPLLWCRCCCLCLPCLTAEGAQGGEAHHQLPRLPGPVLALPVQGPAPLAARRLCSPHLQQVSAVLSQRLLEAGSCRGCCRLHVVCNADHDIALHGAPYRACAWYLSSTIPSTGRVLGIVAFTDIPSPYVLRATATPDLSSVGEVRTGAACRHAAYAPSAQTPHPPFPHALPPGVATWCCCSCITNRGYTRWHSFPELHDSCVVCRGICACRFCLRKNSSVVKVPRVEDQAAAARYVLAVGAPQLLKVLQAEEEEVGGGCAQGSAAVAAGWGW